MILKHRLRFMLLIILALPVFFMIIASIFFINVWYQDMEDSEDLMAPRMIRPQLKEILEGNTPEIFTGIVLVLDHQGNLVYLPSEARDTLSDIQEISPRDFYREVMEKMPPERPFSFSIYRFQGETGLVIYMQQNFQKLYLSQIVWFILLLCYIGLILIPALWLNMMIRPIMKTLLKLENAAREIGQGNLDFAISISRQKGLSVLENAMEQMRKELKENQESQARIMLSISHDLKTPLTSIKGYVEAIQDGMASSPEALEKYTSIIMEKSNLLEERISELIHFSKMRTGLWQARFSPINLKDFMEESLEVFRTDALLQGRAFTGDNRLPANSTISGDEKMLFQVLENLFDNACRYTRQGDSISITADAPDNQAVILVEDSGRGIPEEHRDKIFDTFYRVDQGRNRRGMGIGLASARSIIESHGGQILYRVSEQGGAAFQINLPITK